MRPVVFTLFTCLFFPSSSWSECVHVLAAEYQKMQEELLLDNSTAGRVNLIMRQRIDFCKDKCSSSEFEGICILKKDSPKPIEQKATLPKGHLPSSKAGIAKIITAGNFNDCTDFCANTFDTNKKSRLTCFDVCGEKFGNSK
jgi:hypothetical protein